MYFNMWTLIYSLEILAQQRVWQGIWQKVRELSALEIFVYLLWRPTRWPASFWEVLRGDAGDAVGRLAGAGVLHAEGAGGACVGGEPPGSRLLCQHIAEGLLWWVRGSVSYPVAVWILLKASELSLSQRGSSKQRSLPTPESKFLFQVLPVPSWDFGGHAWDAHR